MPKIEIPESHRALLQLPVATLATIGPDGRPQLSEVWFVAEGDTVRISLNSTRQKTKNLLRNPACTVFILDLSNPGRYLEIRGDAEITEDGGVLAGQVNAKYDANVSDHDHPGEQRFAVTIKPTRVNAVDMTAP
ncbi:MAG TPA: PPOX class F420-dependent oxidoreductase [Acidimicrobiales bacterium]|nr:PPOX class F420-dependent oxidoreductase [Acidimicrobiales bacterium]